MVILVEVHTSKITPTKWNDSYRKIFLSCIFLSSHSPNLHICVIMGRTFIEVS